MPVISRLNPEIKYREVKTIDEEDVGFTSTVYELDLFTEDSNQMTISVAIGKPKYLYTQKNVIFFPIYAVSGPKVRSQIGVFEVESSSMLTTYKNGEIDPTRISDPLLYSFSTPKYLGKLNADPKLFTTIPTADQDNIVEPILEQDQKDYLSLNIQKTDVSLSKTSAQLTLLAGIFDSAETHDNRESLPEETEELAKQYKSEYKESARNTWIEKYMKNGNYRIHENEGGGDCFFAVVRDAFADIGKKTTVEKLRAILSDELTDSVYNEHRSVYLGFQDEIMQLDKEMQQIKHTINEYKKRVRGNGSDLQAADTKSLIQQANDLSAQFTDLKKRKTETEALQNEYVGFIKRVDTLEKMREYVKTSDFWADTWAISTLEHVLNMKMIILSEQAFADTDLDGVVQCGEINKVLQERQQFMPDYYIITSYSGNHYRLVSYRQRKILRFKEIPFDIKVLVLNKCLSKTAGPYYLIQDFRDLKSKYGIDEDEGRPEEYDDSPGARDLFDTDTVFVFHHRANKGMKPGKADGEKMPPEKTADYRDLVKMGDWRKKLDDEWAETPIFIDNKKWASVEHFMQAAKYKKGHPDIYELFSLDSVSDLVPKLSTDTKVAKEFRGFHGKDKEGKKGARVNVIAPDLDFDMTRFAEEREKALRAKFLDNVAMKALLQATNKALLLRKMSVLEPDQLLMKVRADI